MTIQQAIEKAIAGGWPTGLEASKNIFHFEIHEWGMTWDVDPGSDLTIEEIVLQPDFWRALGKTEGWKTSEAYQKQSYIRVHPDGTFTRDDKPVLNQWEIAMHRLIDTLAAGGSIEDFFSSL